MVFLWEEGPVRCRAIINEVKIAFYRWALIPTGKCCYWLSNRVWDFAPTKQRITGEEMSETQISMALKQGLDCSIVLRNALELVLWWGGMGSWNWSHVENTVFCNIPPLLLHYVGEWEYGCTSIYYNWKPNLIRLTLSSFVLLRSTA
jgi:hypothetical protein